MSPSSERRSRVNHWFARFASRASAWAGHPSAFSLAVGVVLGWAIAGPLFRFSDTWQLVINTGTTIMTFLMVFLIQNTMNRDGAAVHIKLDELIRVTADARDRLMNAELLDEDELRQLREQLRAASAEGPSPTADPRGLRPDEDGDDDDRSTTRKEA